MKKEKDSEIIDEEDLSTVKVDIGFKSILMRHLDRISVCVNNITMVGKTTVFCHDVNILHIFMSRYVDKKYTKERSDTKKFYDKKRKVIRDRWIKIRGLDEYGNVKLEDCDQNAYSKSDLDVSYTESQVFLESLMGLMGRRGLLIEDKGIDDAGKG